MGLDREPVFKKAYSIGFAISLAAATLAQAESVFAKPLNGGGGNISPEGVDVKVSYSLPHLYGGRILPPHTDVVISQKGIDNRPLGSWGFLENLDSGRRIVFMYEGATALPSGASLHQSVSNIRGGREEGQFELNPGYYALEIASGKYTENYPETERILARIEFLIPEFPESNATAAEIVSRIYPQMGQTEGLKNFPANHKIEVRVITDREGHVLRFENRDKTAKSLELEPGKGPKSKIRQEWAKTYNPKNPR